MNRIPKAVYTKGFREAARRLSISMKTLANWVRAAKGGKLENVGQSQNHRQRSKRNWGRLKRELASHRPPAGQVQHTDRGSQYCAHAYQKLLKQFGMQASMSRRGNCFDNAPIESFWRSLKNQLVYHRKFVTRHQAQKEITEYIEIFYNRQRTQERLDYRSPAAFTQRFHLNKSAA